MEKEQVKVTTKYLRLTPRKARLVVDLIRGKKAAEADRILRFTPKKAARLTGKVLHSAVAAAKEKNMPEAELVVKTAKVDGGPTLKRGQPVSRGRWHPILKKTSHLTLVLEGPRQKSKKSLSPKSRSSQAESGEVEDSRGS